MNWASDVLAVFEWTNTSNRGEDSKNDYDLTMTGTGITFSSGYWNNGANNTNGYFTYSSTLKSVIAGLSAFTIECKYKTPAKAATINSNDIWFNFAGTFPNNLACNSWSTTDNNNKVFLATNGITAADWTLPSEGTEVRINVEWSGTQYKLYIDGTLYISITTSTNPFTYSGNVDIGRDAGAVTRSMKGNLGRYIISSVARGGAETLPISEPTITDISPNTGTTAGGTAVTITGTEFATGATVTFGGVSATSITVVSATEITCVTPAHVAGAVDVVVANTDTGTVTSAGGFTYVAPSIVDVHYTGKVIPQDFTILLTDSDITQYQTKPYERNEELNVIDTFDFAFDTVSASAPLEFFKFLNTRAGNTLKVKDKAGIVIYAGNVSGVKSTTELDFASKIINIESSPLIEDIGTQFGIYDIAATNPVKVIKQLLDDSVSTPYSVAKLYGLASLLPNINISVDTDSEEDNIKSIIQSICEYFNIGVYLDALTVRAHVAQVLPNNATDILPYLINSQPVFTSRGDLYADKIMLTYSTAVGAAEASVTSGSGDTVKEIQISAPIFMDAASAQATADRALEIYSQKIYEAEIEADKTAMFKLGDTIKYTSVLGDFICLIIGKETTRSQITYKVLGVLK